MLTTGAVRGSAEVAAASGDVCIEAEEDVCIEAEERVAGGVG